MFHFGEFLKTWRLQSESVNIQVNFNRTKIGGKCQNYEIKCDILGDFQTLCNRPLRLFIRFNLSPKRIISERNFSWLAAKEVITALLAAVRSTLHCTWSHSFQFLDKMWNSNSHNPRRQPMNFSSFPHEICSYCNIPISISEAEQWNHLMLCHQDLTIGGGALRCNKCKKQFPNRSALLNHLLFTRVS